MNTLSIIGAGSLGLSLAKGVVAAGLLKSEEIFLTKNSTRGLDKIQELGFGASTDNEDAIKFSNTIVLAVLPQQVNAVLKELQPLLSKDHCIISLVTGLTISQIEKLTNGACSVVRAMPNTAIAVRESMTCICAKSGQDNKLESTKRLFESVGEVIVIEEEQMTSATALCASGIAFFMRAIRAASQGGIEVDFHAGEALKMAVQTAKGAATLLQTNGTHPEREIDNVTSPKGCTIAGLNQMEHNGFSSSFIKAITTSAKKAGGLYEE